MPLAWPMRRRPPLTPPAWRRSVARRRWNWARPCRRRRPGPGLGAPRPGPAGESSHLAAPIAMEEELLFASRDTLLCAELEHGVENLLVAAAAAQVARQVAPNVLRGG